MVLSLAPVLLAAKTVHLLQHGTGQEAVYAAFSQQRDDIVEGSKVMGFGV